MPYTQLSYRVNKRLSTIMAWLTVAFGLIGFCGWLFDSFYLRSFLSNGITMKANSAIMIILSGVALIFLNKGRFNSVRIITGFISLICILIIAEHILKVDLKIDNFFFSDRDILSLSEAPGRVSVLTSVNLLFLCVAIILITLKEYNLSQFLCAILFLLVYAALLGNIFGITGLYRLIGYSGVAFHTAMGLLFAVASAQFYQSDMGWVANYLTHIKGRNISVYVLSYLLCGAPMLVAFYLFIFNRNGFSAASGIVVLVILTAIVSLPVAYFIIKRINRMDDDLITANERLQIALDAAKLGSYELDVASGKLTCTAQCKANYGLPADVTLTFNTLIDTIIPEHREAMQQQLTAAIDAQTDYEAEYQVQWPDESIHWIKIFGKPQYDKDGQAVSVVGVSVNITGQKELEAKKDAFIGMVSHELKTPLTSIKAYLQLANNIAEQADEQMIVDMLTRADVQANKMKNMVQGFLDVTRLENGKLKLDREMFDVKTLLIETIEEVKMQTDNFDIELKDCESFEVYGDRDKIGEVVTNLLTNAIKYSPKNSNVLAECSKEGSWWQFSVTDHGVGINSKEQKKLFERFYRVQRQEHRMVSGFGIGLYLCAEIVKLHKGKIGVHSEEGKGSTFYFTLPV